LLNDERIKSYVAEVLADEKRLPGPDTAVAGKKNHESHEEHEGGVKVEGR
jgi:hypothetical protein